jgi:hypothetical protein
MGLSTSVQQFVERLNYLNRYLLYFPDEFPKQLDQDGNIEILDQSKAPERYEAMVDSNIDIFEMSYKESVSYFKSLENLKNIRCTNGPSPTTLPVENKTRVSLTIIANNSSKNPKSSNMWCYDCDKNNHNTADCRAIAKLKQQHKKLGTRKKSLAFLF